MSISEQYLKDIDSKIESQYGYREVKLSNVTDISTSTPQLKLDPKGRQGFFYENTSGSPEQIDITVFSSTTEKQMTLGQLDSSWFVGSSNNVLTNQEPFIQVSTTSSVITYKLDYTNTHLGHDEMCVFYHGKKPDIATDDMRVIQMSVKTIVSGTAAQDENITDIKVVSDSTALPLDINFLFTKVGFQSNKNKNIAQQVARQIKLTSIDTTSYTPSVNSGVVWNAATPGIGGTSASIDSDKNANITFIGNVSGACVLTCENSLDGVTYYTGNNSFTTASASDFEITYTSGSKYHRLSMSAAGIVVTAIAQSK